MANNSLAYYPGCSGQGTSKEYDMSTRAVCHALDVKLQDIEDWSCCGSTPAHTVDHGLSTALSARNFVQAEEQGLADVTTPCPSCLKNLKVALHRLKDKNVGPEAERILGRSLTQEHSVRSILQVIYEDIGLKKIAAKVVQPLTGLKVVPYYGCLMTRPHDLMEFDDEENPVSMDKIMEAAGATILPFPLKVECCGASMGIPRNDAVTRLTGRLLGVAASLGAEAIVVACPLCQMNLDLRQSQVNRYNKTNYKIPVFYFTQLLGLAFGIQDTHLGFDKLVVDPKPVLSKLMANKSVLPGTFDNAEVAA
ncbi:CoB--CoM heterodisulfide reductase iron-sulfur subunit B family protein [Desulfovibrio sp. OttesenSCG-928-I05]|nr:CoB--CoM heterodisulfide reductase iron-sulfur subunit B family protein [Desulfovibrio sp. OttesenSCG-928-I05]